MVCFFFFGTQKSAKAARGSSEMPEKLKAWKYTNPGLKGVILHSSHSHEGLSSRLGFLPVACEASLKR